MNEDEQLKRLQLIAYGRSSEPNERMSAEEQLASSAATESAADLKHRFLIPKLDVNARQSRAIVAATILLVVVLIAAVFHGTLFSERSTDVFDRSQVGTDLDTSILSSSGSASDGASSMAPVPDSVRFLGEKEGTKAFGYRNYAGDVCLFLQAQPGGGIGGCANESDFNRKGVSLDLGNTTFSPLGGTPFENPPVAAQWGPTGGLEFKESTTKRT